MEAHDQGSVPVLLVDEAQNITRDMLRLIHYLLNYETVKVKLLQIVLVGQDELATRVRRYSELSSRMFPISMNAMSPDELEHMLRFRWMVAGGIIMVVNATTRLLAPPTSCAPCYGCPDTNRVSWIVRPNVVEL